MPPTIKGFITKARNGQIKTYFPKLREFFMNQGLPREQAKHAVRKLLAA